MMLEGTHAFLKQCRGGLLQWNMAIESFLLHVRSISDFLCPPSNLKDDDVIASDFVGSWRCPPPLPENDRLRINKRLAHVSYSRGALPAEWSVDLILERVSTPYSLFLNALPHEVRILFDPRVDQRPPVPQGYSTSSPIGG